MEFEANLNSLTDKNCERLSKPIVKMEIEGVAVYESNVELIDRLDNERRILERYENRESPVALFRMFFERAKYLHDDLPMKIQFNFALESLKEEQGYKPIYGEVLESWCNQPIETIIEQYAELMAYDKVIFGLQNINNPKTENIPNPDEDKQDNLQLEASYMAIKGSNSDTIIDSLYEFLEGGSYIDKIDEKIFKEHFKGNLVSPKINFVKDISILIRLMDMLTDCFHIKFKSRTYKSARFEPVCCHFTLCGNEIRIDNWTTTRSRDKGIRGNENPIFLPIEKFVSNLKKGKS